MDAAWARVRREISQVARQDAEQIRRRSLSRAWALLRYHAGPSLNPAYGDLLAHAGGLAVAPLTAVVENPATRRAASALVPDGQHVQMVFRLGRSPGPLPPTPRREPVWVS